jgi:hypothetical protein
MEMTWRRSAWLLVPALLAGCASVPVSAPDIGRSPWADASASAKSTSGPNAAVSWHHVEFPGKRATQFKYVRSEGREALAVKASSSASMLRTKVRIEPAELAKVRFSWKVPQLIAGADMALKDADDSPVRIVLAFEGDRSRFSPRDALTSELVRTLTGEEMPYATLMYVWCNKRDPGAVIVSPRSGRVRTLVVESGPTKLDQWLDYERDIRADYERAFGEAPGALVGIGIMTDSDNTRTTAQAWYGPVRLGRGVALQH